MLVSSFIFVGNATERLLATRNSHRTASGLTSSAGVNIPVSGVGIGV